MDRRLYFDKTKGDVHYRLKAEGFDSADGGWHARGTKRHGSRGGGVKFLRGW